MSNQLEAIYFRWANQVNIEHTHSIQNLIQKIFHDNMNNHYNFMKKDLQVCWTEDKISSYQHWTLCFEDQRPSTSWSTLRPPEISHVSNWILKPSSQNKLAEIALFSKSIFYMNLFYTETQSKPPKTRNTEAQTRQDHWTQNWVGARS